MLPICRMRTCNRLGRPDLTVLPDWRPTERRRHHPDFDKMATQGWRALLFMNIPIQPDHSIVWEPPVSKPGDVVGLRAVLDCIVVMSACPQDLVPINGRDCKPQSVSFTVSA
jgi:hypothetical protein